MPGTPLFTAVALAGEISIDYRRDADFTSYKTFAWQEGANAADPAMHRLIIEKIEATLASAGLKKAESPETADLHIIYSVKVSRGTQTEVVEKKSLLTGLPNWDYSAFTDYGKMVGQKDITEGTLVINVEEAKSDKLLWSGVAKGYLLSDSMDENQKLAAEAVRLMFTGFPPKKKAATEKTKG